jgi:hypothetical protein
MEYTMPFDGKEFARRDLMLGKLDGVINLLRAEERWCKQQLRTIDGRRCILGALADMDAEALLAGAILEAAREVTGRPYCRIEHFNDHPKTDHRLVVAVLEQARENILSGGAIAVRSPAAARLLPVFYAGLAILGK